MVPTSRLQIVQSPYGGIVQTINVKDGNSSRKMKSSCRWMIATHAHSWVSFASASWH